MSAERDAEVVSANEMGGGLHQLMVRAFSIASEAGELARPIHLLAALAIGDGPIASSLVLVNHDRPLARETDPLPGRGGGSSYLARQADEAAREFASARGDLAGPEHLLVALIDQGDPEVVAALSNSDLGMSALRVAALRLLGSPVDLPPVAMPPLIPAGTMDRPPYSWLISKMRRGPGCKLARITCRYAGFTALDGSGHCRISKNEPR